MKKIIIIIIAIFVLGFGVFELINFNKMKNQNQSESKNENQSTSTEESESGATTTGEAENNLVENKNSAKEELKIETLRQGTGAEAKNGDNVRVDYIGTLEDGTKFDSSYDRGMPILFTLGNGSVIKGWEMGILGMKVGEKRRLTVPPDLAYGESGYPGVIPPNATLIFEVELIGFN
ncbi:MAG: FKBP-type peptidyl-prolyl cis-trans isomerase [Candidatus Pacebacteria bacterium]|nr:FKBP-type peptidyl-prolyl cis-trans isomerase [Candidatus Paceibacterota bacterium]